MKTALYYEVHQLRREMSTIQSQVKNLEKLLPSVTPTQKEIDLPDHLYKTYHALKAIGGVATAEEVANRTGRARAVESAYLNILNLIPIVKKFRKGRHAVFQLLVNPTVVDQMQVDPTGDV